MRFYFDLGSCSSQISKRSNTRY